MNWRNDGPYLILAITIILIGVVCALAGYQFGWHEHQRAAYTCVLKWSPVDATY